MNRSLCIGRMLARIWRVGLFLAGIWPEALLFAQATGPAPKAPPTPPVPPALLFHNGHSTPAATAGRTPAPKVHAIPPAELKAPTRTGGKRIGHPNPLVWDSELKDYYAKAGAPNARLSFSVTNTADHPVTIRQVKTSCGCTVAKFPKLPFVLAPGTNALLKVNIDLRSKYGIVRKGIYVYSTEGLQNLNVRIHIPGPFAPPVVMMGRRQTNMKIAMADRQAVFKNDCAHCHADPAKGLTGRPLFMAACGICHESPRRATMVPDLHALKEQLGAKDWRHWITFGKPGTLMPAFAQSEGGPLTPAQVNSLVKYVTAAFEHGNRTK